MGSKSQTTNTTSSPPPQFLNAYTDLINAGFAQVGQPGAQYGGSLVAGFDPQQEQAFNTIGSAQGMAAPFINAASQYAAQGATPVDSRNFNEGAIDQYYSPYNQDVVSATEQQFNLQNATQQNQLAGSVAQQGAFGGDRQSIAQAALGGQQQTQEAPVIAGLENQGYINAQQEFNTQNQAQMAAQEASNQAAQNAAYTNAMLGPEALNTTLTGASAEMQSGGMQQQLAQEQLNIPYEEFQAQQAYPYQQLNWLAGLVEGAGAGAGGTSSTTTPGPNLGTQLAGLGMGGLGMLGQMGMFAKRGGRMAAGGSAPMTDPRQAYMALAMSPGGELAQRLGRTAWGTPTDLGPQLPGTATQQPTFALGGRPHFAKGGLTGPTGIHTPQIDMGIYNPPPFDPGEMGKWFNPLPQVQNTAPNIPMNMNPGVLQALNMYPVVLSPGEGLRAPQKFGGRTHLADGGAPDLSDLPIPQPNPARQNIAAAGATAMSQDETPPEWQAQATNYGPSKTVWQAPTPSPWRAITNAGLAIAAGRSQFPLTNVAAGLQSGAEEYEKELDTPPTVDHSGSTIMVRYPDEKGDQQILDTGIPTEAALNASSIRSYKEDQQSQRATDEADKQADFAQRERLAEMEFKAREGDRQAQLAIANINAQGTWSMVGTDPETGKAIMLNSKSGQTRIGNLVGAKPGAEGAPPPGGSAPPWVSHAHTSPPSPHAGSVPPTGAKPWQMNWNQ